MKLTPECVKFASDAALQSMKGDCRAVKSLYRFLSLCSRLVAETVKWTSHGSEFVTAVGRSVTSTLDFSDGCLAKMQVVELGYSFFCSKAGAFVLKYILVCVRCLYSDSSSGFGSMSGSGCQSFRLTTLRPKRVLSCMLI